MIRVGTRFGRHKGFEKYGIIHRSLGVVSLEKGTASSSNNNRLRQTKQSWLHPFAILDNYCTVTQNHNGCLLQRIRKHRGTNDSFLHGSFEIQCFFSMAMTMSLLPKKTERSCKSFPFTYSPILIYHLVFRNFIVHQLRPTGRGRTAADWAPQKARSAWEYTIASGYGWFEKVCSECTTVKKRSRVRHSFAGI